MGEISKLLGMSSAADGVPNNGTSPDANMSAAVMGFPSVNMGSNYGNDLPAQGGITGQMPQGDITVTGDAWKPKKPTFLGRLADMFLMSQGKAPVFHNNRDEENMTDAMSNFASDPMTAIRRIARIPGHQKEALALYNEQNDNARQQGNLDRQNNIFDMKKEEMVYERVAGMMGAANPGSWSKMRDLAQTIGSKYGVDVSGLIPKDYDADSIEYIRQGAIKPKDQERIAQSDQRIAQGDKRIAVTQEHNAATEAQAATNETGRQNRHDNPVARSGTSAAKPFMTKYGAMVPSKDGTKGILKHGGKTYGYVKINDKWVPVGEVNVK